MKTLRDLWRRIWSGLLFRIVLALVVVSAIPLAFLAVRLIDLNREALETQVLQTHAVAASTLAQRLEALVGSWDALGSALGDNPSISGDPRSPEAVGLMQDLLASQAALAGIVLTAADGEEIVRLQKRGDADAVTRLTSGAVGKHAQLEIIDGRPWLAVNQPMSERSAWVRLVVAAPELAQALEPEELGEDAAVAVLGEAGRPLLGAEVSQFPRSLVEGAVAGRTKGAGKFEGADREVLGAWAPVSGTDWIVVTRQPASVAERVAAELRERALVAIGIAAILVIVLTLLAWIGVVRPIRRFLEAQRTLEGLPDGSGGDLDQLKLALESLERRIRDKRAFDDVFLGRYRILEVLGEGGMGTVFRGWDPRLHREVALKTIRLGGERTLDGETLPSAINTLLGEAITVAKFNDPNIVSVYDVERTESAAFISMELIEGESLEALLARQRTIPPSQAIVLALQIARGLATAHGQGVIHHDLKPPNILLSRQGSIKITDFGIAGLLSQMGRDSGVIYGTPGYLPPEAITDSVFTSAGDFFGLGLILYRCIAGRNPFARSTVTDTLVATVREQAPALPRAHPEMDGEVDAIVKGLMLKDPVVRELTVGDLVERLETIVATRGWKWEMIPETESGGKRVRLERSAQYVETLSLKKRSA